MRDHVCDSGRISLADPSTGGHLRAQPASPGTLPTPDNVYVYLPVIQEVCSLLNISGCAVSCVWGRLSPLKGPDTLVILVPPLRAPGSTRSPWGTQLGCSDQAHRVSSWRRVHTETHCYHHRGLGQILPTQPPIRWFGYF